jgi:hypothetical protein
LFYAGHVVPAYAQVKIRIQPVSVKNPTDQTNKIAQARQREPAGVDGSRIHFLCRSWRTKQKPVPHLSEAIRRLVELGLKAKR